MNALVRGTAALVTRFPAAVLVGLLAMTVALGVLASQQRFEADMTAFVPQGELRELERRIEDEFAGGEHQLQIIVDAGRGGDVFSPEGLAVAEAVEEAVVEHDEIADLLQTSGPMAGGAVISYATPLAGRLQQMGVSPGEASQRFIDAARDEALSSEQGQRVTALLSRDFDGEEARGGLVIVNLDPEAGWDELREAHLALADAVEDVDTGFVDADAFSFVIVQENMEGGMEEDMPVLLGASFLLIMLILAVQFRRVSDVAIGVVGLLSAVVWMAGLSVLLGPDYLGITGPFSQIAMAVPVLLVGLGIDYSVHLTSRYREERSRGADADASARTAVVTVGVALALATLTTAMGFLSNWTSPLPPISDFGLFAAAGIASAALVLGLLVPSARVLLDRRRAAAGSPSEAGAAPQRRALSRLPVRAPTATLVGGVLVAAVAGVLATGLDTTFSREQFVPEGSYAATMFDRLTTLFGGDISERTDVLVDGDVRDRETFEQLLAAEEALADVEDVRSVGGRAEVTSPASVVRELDRMSDAARQQLAAQFALMHDPEAAADRLPLPEDLTFGDLPEDIRAQMQGEGALPTDDLDLPVDDLDALERRLPPGVSAVEALLGTLPGAELVGALRQGAAERIEEQTPDVDPAVLAELAALEPGELTAERIRSSGYPVEELSDEALELIGVGDRLRELGWRGDALADDADVAAILATAREHAGDELDGVLSDDAALMTVSTQAGEQGAQRLAADIEEALAPLAATVPGGVAVMSDQLLMDATLQQMTDSQIRAIVVSLLAALVLMTVYYAVSARRPLLGPITMLPSVLSVPLILGSMWAVGLSFNALTATVSSIAIGIGVPYGIHVTNRYLEERAHGAGPATTVHETLRHTGAALVGSAVTTTCGFGVLLLSDLTPMRQFGGVTSVTILYALITALLVESSALVLWDRWHRRRAGHDPAGAVARPAPEAEEAAPAPALVHQHDGGQPQDATPPRPAAGSTTVSGEVGR